MKNNLKELRKRMGLTQYDVADKIGMSQPQIYKFEAGEKKLTLPQMEQFAELYKVKVEELYGDIKPLSSEPQNTVTIDIISATPCCGTGEDKDYADEIVGKWVMPINDFKDITFARPQDVKQMRVIGDSMEPTIRDGDFILVDVSHNSFDVDGIYLIRMVNGLAVKRLQAGLSEVKIHSDNKRYEPITAKHGDVYIIGKVIKIMNMSNV